MKIQSFKDLTVWQKGHSLVLRIYRATQIFPKSETYGLASQLRRASVSVTSNIAEGFSRRSGLEKKQFYSLAQGSIFELQSQILIARDIDLLSEQEFVLLDSSAEELARMLTGLIRSSATKPEIQNTKY